MDSCIAIWIVFIVQNRDQCTYNKQNIKKLDRVLLIDQLVEEKKFKLRRILKLQIDRRRGKMEQRGRHLIRQKKTGHRCDEML